ncbi:MAG: Glutaryl-7-ACA acylase [Labilithrix sp.]|nr:Glutaryl-7-ACA acylase [Labilithrix sp.]
MARSGLALVLLTALAACGGERPVATSRPSADGAGSLVAEPLTDEAAVLRALRVYYTKTEVRIPMRDGTHLFTAIYAPKDHAAKHPILLHRTPYSVGPYGADNLPKSTWQFPPQLVRDGVIFVFQDVRGALMSEGTYVDVRPAATTPGGIDESTDAYDTIDWLVKQVPGNSGRVGISGISYPGFYAAQAAVNAHPALKAVSPQAPVTEWFLGDDFHHHGAFFLAEAFDFYATFGKARAKPTKKKLEWGYDYGGADAYDFFLALGPVSNVDARHFEGKIAFWNEVLSHPNRDAWWQARDPRPRYRVKPAAKGGPAILTVGGFFDNEDCFGALETYRAFEQQSPGADNALVMGPWRHGGWTLEPGDKHGDLVFGQATGTYFRDEIEAPFFRKHLLGQGAGTAGTEAFVFATGENTWHRYPSWPPPGSRSAALVLGARGTLSPAPAAAPAGDLGFESFVSDPRKPVPYRAKPSSTIDYQYMSEDQRFAGRRPDVLTYASRELTADVTLAGPLEADLWVSTTGTDADFVVKLIDAYPEENAELPGYQQLVRGDVMRARFRESYERPVPFVPGQPARVKFTLPDVAHTFRPGHRILVQVQSSWFPLVDRNPQSFVPNIELAQEPDFVTATHRVYRTAAMRSSLTVTVAAGALPD